MKGRGLLSAVMALALLSGQLRAQDMTLDQARQDGEAFGNAQRASSATIPTDNAQAAAVPGYNGTTTPQSGYFDNPEAMMSAGSATAPTNEAFRITTDADNSRPTFSNDDIKAITNSATQVSQNPETYLAGESVSSSKGDCTPLPPSSGGVNTFEARCNVGEKVTQDIEECKIPVVPQFTEKTDYRYTCGHLIQQTNSHGNWDGESDYWQSCTGFQNAPQCHLVSSDYTNYRQYIGRVGNGIDLYQSWKYDTWSCTAPTTSPNDPGFCIAFGCFKPDPVKEIDGGPTYTYTGSAEDLSACSEQVQQNKCVEQSSTCIDLTPTTRTINGVDVTQSCWEYSKTFQCTGITSDNDCSSLEPNHSCTYSRTDCLDDPQDGPCKVEERVYLCPVPSDPTKNPAQYICGNDVYCINGDCQPIVRQADQDFKDAVVALHAIGEAGDQLDPNNLTVFGGTLQSCHKPLFGLVNCCAGKTSGALPVAAGLAALAGGPTALIGVVTPFLVFFGCSSDEMKLDVQDRMGFCHNLGSYCSGKVLGICTTERVGYCCFESKLSRILQEQGRPQLGIPWGSPKDESCKGFTVEQFSQLDLSQMDFTEIYSDFVDAAKLPDEVQTMTTIQQKIQSYYDLHSQ